MLYYCLLLVTTFLLKITSIHCFVLFPGVPGGPSQGSPGPPRVSSQKVRRVSEVSRSSLEGSRRLMFGTSVNIRLLLIFGKFLDS